MIHSLDQKTRAIIKAILIGMAIICARLLYLQVHLTDYLFKKSQKNFTRVEKVLSPRGNIIDCTGKLLATNRPIINLYWQGTGNRRLTDTQQTTLSRVETILEKRICDKALMLKLVQSERRSKKLLIATDLTFEQLGRIAEQFADEPNIDIDKHFQRYYPHGCLASHILGYLGYIDLEAIGKMGLENKFNHTLKGQSGTMMSTVNSLGTRLTEQELEHASSGQTITTTIDLNLQKIAEKVFSPEQTGTMIVMDPENGDLKALVSRPNFDPALFLKPISTDEWRELQEQKPFINRAFNACYPPASIFKLVTLAAALESNLISPDTLIMCKGSIVFGKRRIHCARRYGGHGILNVKESVAQSCNILFFEIGKRLDIDTLSDYARRFGLGQKTGVIFQEKVGLMPTRAWKKETTGQPWWPGDTLQATIGQSYLLTTPIQIARMVSSIFTGYLVAPRLVATEPVQTTPLAISEQTLEFLQESMNAVVMKGTGKHLRSLAYEGFILHAKTGTAQTSHLSKRKLGRIYLEHAWSVVHFSYKNGRPLILVVLIEHAGTTRPANACVKQFLIRLRKLRKRK